MNEVLTKLGVSPAIQSLFNIRGDLRFDYGDGLEHYFEGGHLVPASQNLWKGGSELAMQVILAPSVMELICFMALNAHRFSDPQNLLLLATGNSCSPDKLHWIRSTYRQRKFILAYGKDPLGCLTDIKVAMGLRGRTVAITWSDQRFNFTTAKRNFYIDQELVSLREFERQAATGLRARALKPYRFNTWLEQLKNDER